MKKLLVTRTSGLINSKCLYFANQGWAIHGIDNNRIAIFFGSQQKRLETQIKGFVHHEIDVRDRAAILDLIDSLTVMRSCIQQHNPATTRAATIPFDDFDINAVGTLNLLEATRTLCPKSLLCAYVYQQSGEMRTFAFNSLRIY